MGLEVISFTIKEVRDKNEYIVNMGRPDVAASSVTRTLPPRAERDTAIRRASRLAKPRCKGRRRTRSECSRKRCPLAKQAEAQRDLEVKKAQYLEVTKKQQAQADKAYDIQANIMQQQVSPNRSACNRSKRRAVKVQEAESMS